MIVKSGCEKLRSRSGSSCASAGDGAAARASRTAATASTVGQRITTLLDGPESLREASLVVRGTDLDPAPDDPDLAVGQERPRAARHADPDDPRAALDLVNEIAVLRIARNHAHG